jgi:hypothetical protein
VLRAQNSRAVSEELHSPAGRGESDQWMVFPFVTHEFTVMVNAKFSTFWMWHQIVRQKFTPSCWRNLLSPPENTTLSEPMRRGGTKTRWSQTSLSTFFQTYIRLFSTLPFLLPTPFLSLICVAK